MRPFLTLHHPARARQYYAEGTWQADTFYSLLAGHAQACPDAPALRDGDRRLTWREVAAWVDAMAADLHRHGLVGGDRVSIWMSNKLETIITFSGLLARGLCLQSVAAPHLYVRGDRATARPSAGKGVRHRAGLGN